MRGGATISKSCSSSWMCASHSRPKKFRRLFANPCVEKDVTAVRDERVTQGLRDAVDRLVMPELGTAQINTCTQNEPTQPQTERSSARPPHE